MEVDWEKVKTEYITTKISYRDLAKKYKIPRNTLCHRGKTEKWVELRDRFCDKVVTDSVKKTQREAANYRSEIYALAQNIVDQLSLLTKKNNLEKLLKMGLKPKDITGAIKDLEEALHIKSTEDLKEQQARIKKLRKDVEATDKGGAKVEITIKGNEETWVQ